MRRYEDAYLNLCASVLTGGELRASRVGNTQPTLWHNIADHGLDSVVSSPC